jgi:hypothetical protein
MSASPRTTTAQAFPLSSATAAPGCARLRLAVRDRKITLAGPQTVEHYACQVFILVQRLGFRPRWAKPFGPNARMTAMASCVGIPRLR